MDALQQEPRAFGESTEEHRAKSVQVFAKRLAAASGDQYILGAFAEGNLVGTVGFGRNTRVKERHKARIWGVYVDPGHRGQGVARQLLREVLERAASLEGLERIILTVGEQQDAARRLYAAAGFVVFGHEQRALKIGEAYVSEDYMVFDLLSRAKL